MVSAFNQSDVFYESCTFSGLSTDKNGLLWITGSQVTFRRHLVHHSCILGDTACGMDTTHHTALSMHRIRPWTY